MNKFLNRHLNLIIIILGIINLGIVLIFEVPCPWKTNFNIDCAGCGSTRMFKSLFELDLYQAFRFNPFMFCLLIIGIIYLIYYIICKIKHKKYYKIKDRDWLILLGLVIAFTIMRNISIFSWLKPTIVR
ncbi:MAG: DUF2752 domain-containing protein [Bacilli bacterium]|nr:DUF2752 domain-containing protein [Bacilli bacterium]